MVDGQAGLQPGDGEILDWLRHNHPGKPVVLAVNKCESTTKADIQVGRAPDAAEAAAVEGGAPSSTGLLACPV
jgi:predicted GTPase